ncbi:MAG: hypothetical protein NVSMB62_01580 [Acidobacteriaceae bacterium]
MIQSSIRITLAVATLTLIAATCSAQQSYIGRYDLYVGFADLESPTLGLNQKGVNTQIGLNPTRWLSFGFDYSNSTGTERLTADLLSPALQARVNSAQAGDVALGLLPANYHLAVSTDAATQTFALGPQLMCRHFQNLALFLRPALGALREHAVPHPGDAFATVIVKQLAPAGFKDDWTGFYGVGGGGDVTLAKHLSLRLQIDVVHDHPFDDILPNGRWTYRFAVGPSIHLGRNVLQ